MGWAGLGLVAMDDAVRHEPRLRDDARPQRRNPGRFWIIRCLGPAIGPGWRASCHPRPARASERQRRSPGDARAGSFFDTRCRTAIAAISRLHEILERPAPTVECKRAVAGPRFLLAAGAASSRLGSILGAVQCRRHTALSGGVEPILRQLARAVDR